MSAKPTKPCQGGCGGTVEGRKLLCGECLKERNRQRCKQDYSANREKRKASARLYREANLKASQERERLYNSANREKRREAARLYFYANREKLLEGQRHYREANRDRDLERYRLRYAANPEKMKEEALEWARRNPIRMRTIRRRRRQRLIGVVTDAQWSALLEACGCRCLKCGTTERITVDHVIPISQGGTNTIDNLQPLCHSCNSSKYTKTVDYRSDVIREHAASLYSG